MSDRLTEMTKSVHSEVTPPASVVDLRKGMEALADALPIQDSCEISQGMIGERSCLIISPADVIAERKILYFHGGWVCKRECRYPPRLCFSDRR